MSDELREKLRAMERELRGDGAMSEDGGRGVASGKSKRAMRRTTKRKILVGAALAIALLVVWKKVHIQFVVHTSFWGFLGILGAVFFVIYLTLHFFFADKDE